jgi:hypothetical protein
MQKYVNRYLVAYYRFVQTVGGTPRPPDAYGASPHLNNLVRNAAGRCAIENYRQAVVTDRRNGAVVKILRRTTQGITIRNPPGE